MSLQRPTSTRVFCTCGVSEVGRIRRPPSYTIFPISQSMRFCIDRPPPFSVYSGKGCAQTIRTYHLVLRGRFATLYSFEIKRSQVGNIRTHLVELVNCCSCPLPFYFFCFSRPYRAPPALLRLNSLVAFSAFLLCSDQRHGLTFVPS